MAWRAFDLAHWLLTLLRRLLYLGIRTRCFPDTTAELALTPGVPVCYVLEHRHLSNLLVLDQESRRLGLPRALRPLAGKPPGGNRSFFFLTRPFAAGGRQPSSPLLRGLVAKGLADPAFDVHLLPVTILWGQAPKHQQSILGALFAETWRTAGLLRQAFAILIHGRNTVVRFNPPLSLRELLRDEVDTARAERKLGRILRVHFRRQREMAIGPDLSHRHILIRDLLASPAVQAAIVAEADGRGIPREQAARHARAHAEEIVADYSYGTLRALELFLHWLWTRLYDGIDVHHFERVTEIAAGQGIVYVPCHRSHVDYLLLSYLIFRRGLMPPHIAAGANLDIPLVGPLLRQGGAFFLRRTIRGEALYAAVFVAYLQRMIASGFPIEYFIEGGRSRSGRMLAPKAGILGMTIQGHVASQDRPLVFVPVYIGYEKLMEGATYVAELGGRPKRGESLLGVLRTARRVRREFGRVQVNVGQPLALAPLLDRLHPAWRTEAADARAPWLRDAVRTTAEELARRINDAATINPINLVALALLATPRHAADRRHLERQIAHLQALLDLAPYGGQVVPCTLPAAEIVDHALRLGAIASLPHALGEILRVEGDAAARLAYFRNNVLHVFVLPALLACLVAQNRQLARADSRAAVAGIYGLLHGALFLHWDASQLDAAVDAAEAALVSRALLRVDSGNGLIVAPPPHSTAFAELQQVGDILRPTLERLFLAITLLRRHGSGRLTRTACEDAGHLLAQRLALLYAFNGADAADRASFSQLIATLEDTGLIEIDAEGMIRFDNRIAGPAAHAELLLPAEVRHSIERMAAGTLDGD